MLILRRKLGEKVFINHNIVITLVEIRGKDVRFGIEAPESDLIFREEVYRERYPERFSGAEPVTKGE